jgi:hypothetical protein
MAAGATYPVDVATLDGVGATGTVRVSGSLIFTDSTNQPAPGGNNQATVPAATATTSAPRISQLSSYLTILSGTLPNLGAWVSGTAKVNPVARQIVACLEVVTDATNNAATCAVAISPDNTTFTTIATPGTSAAVNNLGAVTLLSSVVVPQGWYIKITFAHCTVAASIYY